jgi:hypothetical protein
MVSNKRKGVDNMTTQINIYNEETGVKEASFIYSLGLKESIIATIEQVFKGNFKTWEYPADVEGVFAGSSRIDKNRLYKQHGDYIIQAWEI